jgi:LPXTG-site transpeptidase (sortase) family protein
MRDCLQFWGRVLVRMGILSLGTVFLASILTAYLILEPNSKLSQKVDTFMAEWVMSVSSGIQPFTADEFIFDYSLRAEVPYLYELEIPKLKLSAPVVTVSQSSMEIDGEWVKTLNVPNAFAVGWSDLSAPVGARGNTVLVGHNNIYGEVFKNLWDLEVGDEIILRGPTSERIYKVEQRVVFEEKDQPLQVRLANAHWFGTVPHEQLTLVTCWPYFTNSHRIVIVALPA